MSFVDSVRNPQGLFVNVSDFSSEAKHFQKYGYYCADLPGTPGHYNYWQEQFRRCSEGYSSGGVYITGHHYAYLNFFPIRRVVSDKGEATSKDAFTKSKSARKIMAFPDFYDGDYNFFHTVQIAKDGISKEDYLKLQLEVKIREEDLLGGKHLGVGKARRKGYSFKNAAICANTYNTVRDSVTIIGAYEKKFLYPEGTMGMATEYLNWLNTNTAWTKRQVISRMEHIKSGYKELINGVEITKGFKSQLIAVTFKDNPDAARGKDGTLILMDEAGKFPNLKDAYLATKPTVESGIFTTGLIIFFGTGGKDNHDWADFSEMFNNPDAYNCMAFENIWEDGAGKPCGFFHPDYVTKDGFVDLNGNSLRSEAVAYEEKIREKLRVNAKDKTAYTQHLIEYPFSPKEAFSLSAGNIFPAADLISHRNWLESQLDDAIAGLPGEFIINEVGKPIFQVNFDLKPATFPSKHGDVNTDGCWVIWEQPVENAPYGLYVAGTDPYNKDQAPNSVSMGSTFIIKRAMVGYDNHDKIVAEYTGRPLTAESYYEGVRRGMIFYNALNLYENNFNGMKMHFQHQSSLQYLAYSPGILKANANTSVARTYGLHMTKVAKDELELITSQWLSAPCGEGRMNLQNIYSIPLLNELIMYNEDGNFDRCFTGDTLVTTNKGFKKIEDVKKGDVVLTTEGAYKEVIETFCSDATQLVSLNHNGSNVPLNCTPNHPILVASNLPKRGGNRHMTLDLFREHIEMNKDYDYAENIKKGDYVLIPKRKELPETSYEDDLLYLMGWYTSDGYVNIKASKLTFCLALHQEHVADKLVSIIEKYTDEEEHFVDEYTRSNGTVVAGYGLKKMHKAKKQVLHNCILVHKTSKSLSNLLYSECGGPNAKILSPSLYNNSNLLPFVLGFFEGDGHQKKNANYDGYKRECLELSGVHIELIQQVRQILLDNNIWCTYELKPLSKNKNHQQQARITICGEEMNPLVTNSLLFSEVSVNRPKTNVIKTEDGFWTPVTKVSRYDKDCKVYNLGVMDHFTYIANTLAVHNCISLMLTICQKVQMHQIVVKQKEQQKEDSFWSRKLYSPH